MPNSIDARQSLTVINVLFPTSGLTYTKTPDISVSLVQRDCMHDVAIIKLPQGKVSSATLQFAYGVPVSFAWSSYSGRGTFVGYVHSAVPWVNSGGSGYDITAVGASMPLKAVNQRVWTNTTASQVARLIASEHHLAFDVEEHSRVFPQITQDGISDWSVLRTLADRVGYSLRMEGVTLQFVSRGTLARYYRSLAPATRTSLTDYSTIPSGRDIISFQPVLGEHQPESGDVRAFHTVKGIDPVTGVPFSATASGPSNPGRAGSSPIQRVYSTETARSHVEAQHIAQAAADKNRYPIRAKATMYGNPELAPGRVLFIDSPQYKMAGYWTVLSADHTIKNGVAYTMDVELGTEAMNQERMAPSVSRRPILPTDGLLKTPYAEARLLKSASSIDAVARWVAV